MNAINAIVHVANNADSERRRKLYRQRINSFDLFNKNTVRTIIDLVENDLVQSARGGGTCPELQVLVAIRCWGRREVQDDAGDLHGLSQPTVSRICARVAHAIANKANSFIKMPITIGEQERISAKFRAIKNFHGVIGAIDCTHIKIQKTGGDMAQYYINRKGYLFPECSGKKKKYTVVCDADLKIMDIVARWRGSTHDSRFFMKSNIKKIFQDRQFRRRLIGDSGYPLLRPEEEAYNNAHISTRNTVERCFVNLQNGKAVIIALAVSHNIAIDMNDTLLEQHMVQQVPVTPQLTTENSVSDNCPSLLRRRSQLILQNFINQHF
ncbi:hypothetical protein ABMA28_009362 [Loxostege sticticalis]|uniref:DDE Tnp4 domain-containing protein n=1 Tax=Loxostege sticticalis TaxID=481309 RepID=A0ABD0SF82_LOXSC